MFSVGFYILCKQLPVWAYWGICYYRRAFILAKLLRNLLARTNVWEHLRNLSFVFRESKQILWWILCYFTIMLIWAWVWFLLVQSISVGTFLTDIYKARLDIFCRKYAGAVTAASTLAGTFLAILPKKFWEKNSKRRKRTTNIVCLQFSSQACVVVHNAVWSQRK